MRTDIYQRLMTTKLKLRERYCVKYIRKTDTATNEVREPEIPKITFPEYNCYLLMVALWQEGRRKEA